MKVAIRKFEKKDIPNKVKWINNPENNKYLHYDLPLEIEKTEKWFDNNKYRTDRFDAVIEMDNIPVGTIGLLSIDKKNNKAEFYIAMGETDHKGKGVAKRASLLVLKYGFEKLGLNKIYLFTEVENIAAQKLFERIGFINEGHIREDVVSGRKYVDRYIYGLLKSDWMSISEKYNDL